MACALCYLLRLPPEERDRSRPAFWLPYCLSSLKFELLGVPSLKSSDGLPLDRQFYVRIDRVHVLAAGMAHEGLSDFLHDAGFHQARVEGVSEVMEAEMAIESVGHGRSPSSL